MFARKCSYDYWSNGPIILQYIPLYGQTFHPYSTLVVVYLVAGVKQWVPLSLLTRNTNVSLIFNISFPTTRKNSIISGDKVDTTG